MGIQGLLPFLQKCSRKVDMSEFSGCTVAVDAYCWLHKGVFSCAEKLARGEDTDQYVNYCMKYINMLSSHNIKVILVFDGCHLPAKAETESARREKREATKKKACELLRADRGDDARQLLRRCVDVTHTMAHKLIKRARAANVDCIVAPYEADAQLAYLNISSMAHFVITEDSDLLLFGCKKVVFKLDVGGAGLLIEQEMLSVAMKMRPEEFSLDKFRQMCILSGCDYLQSLPGIGLTKASKFVKLTSHSDISKVLHKIGSYLNMPNLSVTEEYKYKFACALSMFRHQPAFDPRKRKVVPLTPVEEGVDISLPPPHPPDTAFQLALGNIDPILMKIVDDWDPDTQLKDAMKKRSIWSHEYKKPLELPPTRIKPTTAVSTFGKKISVITEDICPLAISTKKSDEDELEELRGAWGVVKKRRREDSEASEKDEVTMDELVEPSPPRPNPFRTPQPNLRLTPSTTLRRLTSPSGSVSEYFSPTTTTAPSSQKESNIASPSAPTLPLVISRYFCESSSPSFKSNQSIPTMNNSPSAKIPDISNTDNVQPMIITVSPNKTDDKRMRKNIFLVSSPKSVMNESDTNPTIKDHEPRSAKKIKSLLSTMENDDEENVYNKSRCTVNTPTLTKSKLSNFKWKPLISNEIITSLDKPNKEPSKEVLPDTPPNSQETGDQTNSNLPKYLETPRTIGLSKNSSPAMQAFLSKFKFQPKAKIKKK